VIKNSLMDSKRLSAIGEAVTTFYDEKDGTSVIKDLN
jgi:hypothetical protein